MGGTAAHELDLVGSCKIIGASGSSAPADGGFRTGNVQATARSAAGSYTVTLQAGNQADDNEHVAIVQTQGGAVTGNAAQLTWTNDGLLTIVTPAAGVAADPASLKVMIFKVR